MHIKLFIIAFSFFSEGGGHYDFISGSCMDICLAPSPPGRHLLESEPKTWLTLMLFMYSKSNREINVPICCYYKLFLIK